MRRFHPDDPRRHTWRYSWFLSAILDYLATSEPNLYLRHGVLTVSATDHLPIFVNRNKFEEEPEKEKIYGTAYSPLKPEEFKREVNTTDWSVGLNEQDPDIAWSIFKSKYLKILDTHAPYKFFHSRADKKPWVTTEFLENANERDNLSRMAKSRGCPVLKERHRRDRSRVVSLKREHQ